MRGGWVENLWWEKSPDELTQRRLPGLNMMAKNILVAALIIVIVTARQDQAPSYEELGENDLGFVSYSPFGRYIIQGGWCVHCRIFALKVFVDYFERGFSKIQSWSLASPSLKQRKTNKQTCCVPKRISYKSLLILSKGNGKNIFFFNSTNYLISLCSKSKHNLISSKIYPEYHHKYIQNISLTISRISL